LLLLQTTSFTRKNTSTDKSWKKCAKNAYFLGALEIKKLLQINLLGYGIKIAFYIDTDSAAYL